MKVSNENDAQRTAAETLMTAGAVRERAQMVMAAGLERKLAHFRVHDERLPAAADYVADTIRRNYPGLAVPFHARWRHFVVDGVDRWQAIADTLDVDRHERARIRVDLAVTSVLLDAGAGPHWRWHDPQSGRSFARSEGLALASLEAFRNGLFSTGRGKRLQADAPGLMRLTPERLAAAFQVAPDNPLTGLEGRAGLLNRLGAAIMQAPELFGAGARIGGLYDTLRVRAAGSSVPAPEILRLLLVALGPIWPGRMTLGGINLGDCWRHSQVRFAGPTDGLIPFHKLSQWLAYSLIEPLQEAGVTVSETEGLTGLAEYRNGGLFIDLGVLEPVDPALMLTPMTPADEPIVEWRALTVGLLDAIAPLVRARLGLDAERMPLASVLEGGTWSAGRRIARERRADGSPPIAIVSDGSVF